jgi:hypothetical protein
MIFTSGAGIIVLHLPAVNGSLISSGHAPNTLASCSRCDASLPSIQ